MINIAIMYDKKWAQKIIDSAINGNEFPFDRFFEVTFKKLLPKPGSLTKSKVVWWYLDLMYLEQTNNTKMNT